MPSDSYIIRAHFMDGNGWLSEDNPLPAGTTLYHANEVATTRASELDRDHGNSHFWTVDIISANGGGSYYQYFHGRTS